MKISHKEESSVRAEDASQNAIIFCKAFTHGKENIKSSFNVKKNYYTLLRGKLTMHVNNANKIDVTQN